MNFAGISTEVQRIVARPDKVTEVAMAINKAVSYCTLKGSFPRDLVEASLAIDSSLYGDTISLSALTRFRRFTYVKPVGVKYYLKSLEADKIFTPKNQMQPNVYYVAGTSLTYTLSALASSLEVGYLTYPATLSGTDSHWLFDIMPYAIIDLAASFIFSGIGDDTSARIHEARGMEFFLTVRRDLALGE